MKKLYTKITCLLLGIILCLGNIFCVSAAEISSTSNNFKNEIKTYIINLSPSEKECFFKDPYEFVNNDSYLSENIYKLSSDEVDSFYTEIQDDDISISTRINEQEFYIRRSNIESALKSAGIPAKCSYHAAKRSVERGISVNQIINTLKNGVRCIDIKENSKIAYDYSSKIAIAIDKASNTLITMYRSEFKSWRWVKSFWKW